MKKLIIGLMILSLSISMLNAGVTTSFFEKLVKMTKGKVDDVVKKIPSAKTLNKTLSKNIDAQKLAPIIKKDPEKILLANKAQKIVDKGNFEKNFFNNQSFDNQLSMIVQSSKYGNEYFVVAKKISHISPSTLKNNQQLLKYIPSHKISQLNQQTLQTKFIEVLNKTGKYGWSRLEDIGKFALKNPTYTLAGSAYAWYILDPVGFEEALKNSGKELGLFLTTSFGALIDGAAEAGKETANKSWEDFKSNPTSYISENIFGLLILISLFIVWRKRKIIKHFLLKADAVEKENITINKKNVQNEKEDGEF